MMIYTFYSYKGGVGRTMALANVAELFYQAGLKVLMVDWDLEAPGLERFFPSLDLKETLDKLGLMDMILHYKERMAQETSEDTILELESPEQYILDVYPNQSAAGKLFLLTTGRRSKSHFADYTRSVLTFDWQDFYKTWGGELYFNWLREQFESIVDVVLIDSRTGLTEMGGICTHHMADTVVMFCASNQQNLSGTHKMVQNFTNPKVRQSRGGRSLGIIIVPSRLEQAEGKFLNRFKQEFVTYFKDFTPSFPEYTEDFWGLGIPYIPYYAYNEVVAVREQEEAIAEPIVEAFEKLVHLLALFAPHKSPLRVTFKSMPNIKSAQQRLASMPVEIIPEPTSLPKESRIPFSLNPFFIGRIDDMQALAKLLRGEVTKSINQIVVITGLGGIGKSQLATEFVYRYGQYFAGGIFWLNFADPNAIAIEIAACGGPDGLNLQSDFTTLPLADQVQLVISTWKSPIPRLLVFDNCEDEALLEQWRPPVGGCRVLVTSRRGRWDPILGVHVLQLKVLSRAESIELLRKHRPDIPTDDIDLQAIAEELGDLPLALHLTGSFLATFRQARLGTPAIYLTELRQAALDHPSLTGEKMGFSPTDHEQHIARSFTLSYQRLDPTDVRDILALALLTRASYFAPNEPIPRSLLISTLRQTEINSKTELDVEQAITRLITLGLLESHIEGGLVLHRLLAIFVQRRTDDRVEAEVAVEQTLLEEADHLNKAGYPIPILAWQVHLRVVTDMAQLQENELAANLCNTLGYHLVMIGDYIGARIYYERALAIKEKILEAEHPEVASGLNNLGSVLQDLGDLTKARFSYERALAIYEKTLGEEHPHTAGSLNNLGSLLQDLGEQTEAHSYYQRALAIQERVLGTEHPDTALTLNNIGSLLQEMGDLADARPYYEQALAINEKTLGTEHPDTALTLNNIGSLLQEMGDLADAHPYYKRALAIREKILGTEHPDTATSLNNLGGLLQRMGNLDKAQLYFERVLAIREKSLGTESVDLATSLNNLGHLLQLKEELTEARSYYQRALAIQEKVLGTNHPYTAISLNNLGHLLQATGNLAEARSYFVQALDILKDRLGSNHPNTQIVRKNLVGLLKR